MWTPRYEALFEEDDDQQGVRISLDFNSQPATFADVLHGWRNDPEFCGDFSSILSSVLYTAYRFETPPVTTATLTQPFEFVLLEDREEAEFPSPEAFAEHFTNAESDFAVFPNLSGDAILVAPCPVGEAFPFGHLASFVRMAPKPQRRLLWKTVGDTMAARIGDQPVWLSTTGGSSAPWLHVRLDNLPKFYAFTAYIFPR